MNCLEVLHEAARNGWEEDSVSILVNELNVDPDEEYEFNDGNPPWTPLQRAAENGSVDVLKVWSSVS